MIRVATSALLLLAAVSASPLWLRPEAPLRDLTNLRAMDETYLLPKTLIPSQYTVTLIPYLKGTEPTPEKEFKFDGTVTITLTCSEATDMIVMHAYDIAIVDKTKVKVMVKDTTTPLGVKTIAMTEQDKDGKQFFTITMDQSLEVATEYDVMIEYEGNLNEDLDGFYRSSYMEGGVEK
jgi:aminopeptidase N